jgi:hypothetical protein
MKERKRKRSETEGGGKIVNCGTQDCESVVQVAVIVSV